MRSRAFGGHDSRLVAELAEQRIQYLGKDLDQLGGKIPPPASDRGARVRRGSVNLCRGVLARATIEQRVDRLGGRLKPRYSVSSVSVRVGSKTRSS
jgi:hypothetical protein